MPLQAKVLSDRRSFKSLVSPVISVTIHSDIQRALGFSNILLSTLATRDQIHNILCPTIGVTFKLDTSTNGRCGCLRGGYHSTGLTSWSATGFTFSKRFVIGRFWLQSSPHKMVFEAFWSPVGHDWLLREDCAQMVWWVYDGPVFVDDTPGFRKVWMICQDKWQNSFVCCRLGLVRQKILSSMCLTFSMAWSITCFW